MLRKPQAAATQTAQVLKSAVLMRAVYRRLLYTAGHDGVIPGEQRVHPRLEWIALQPWPVLLASADVAHQFSSWLFA